MEQLGWWKKVRSSLAPHALPSASGEALLEAAQVGDAHGVRALLALGTPPDAARTPHGETALCLAAHRGHADAATALLGAGADPGAEDATGVTPLTRAAAAGHGAVVALVAAVRPAAFLTQAAARALRLAALNGHALVIREMLQGGTPVDARPRGYPSALFAAAITDSSCLAELLDAGADPHEVDPEGQTAMHHAAAANQPGCVRMLLGAGTDLHARSSNGYSAADLAVTDAVRRLLPPYARLSVGDLAALFDTIERPRLEATAPARPLTWP